MKIYSKLLFVLCASLLVVSACNNNNYDDKGKDTTGGDQATETTGNNSDNDTSTAEETPESSTGDDQATEDNNKLNMGIGESAIYKMDIGTFKITVDSVDFIDQAKNEVIMNDLLVKVRVKIENVGEKSFYIGDIYTASIYAGEANNENESNAVPDTADTSDNFDPLITKGDLAPGQSLEGDLVFDTWNSDFYTLVFENDTAEIMGNASWKLLKE